MFVVVSGCAVLMLSGCASNASATQPTAGPKKSGVGLIFANIFGDNSSHELQAGAGDNEVAQSTAPRRTQVQQLDVYLVAVPLGAVSRSNEFWKRVDEATVDPATYDLLYKNGIRVGVARTSEWSYFKSIIDQYPAHSRNASVSGGDAGALQLDMKKAVPWQDIFYFTDENILYGRSYEKSDNLLGISFLQAPRKPGTVRMSVCPTVRSLRKTFEERMHGEEHQFAYVSPEKLYDLNLTTDVPLNSFLVIAPSQMAKWEMSIGAAFFVSDGVAEQFENVLLLVPRLADVRAEK